MDRFTLVPQHSRLRFHGDDLERAHGVEVAQAAVGHRTNSAGTAAEKSADRCFDDGRGIAAQFPSRLARFGFEGAQAHAGLADGDAVGLNRFDAVHAREIKHYSALERNRLAVVAGARAAHRYRKIVGVAVAQYALDLDLIQRLHHQVSHFAVELLAQYRRVPVEVARKPFHHLGLGEDARVVIRVSSQCGGVAWIHHFDSVSSGYAVFI